MDRPKLTILKTSVPVNTFMMNLGLFRRSISNLKVMNANNSPNRAFASEMKRGTKVTDALEAATVAESSDKAATKPKYKRKDLDVSFNIIFVA